MIALAVGACLVLASSAVLEQAAPQRVERITEYRWCVLPDGYAFESVRRRNVDGRPAGSEDVTRLLRVETSQPISDAVGY